MRLQCAGLTDTGMVRDHNEDSFLVSQTESFVVVADGMGGHQSGEVASRMAINEIESFYEETLKQESPIDLPLWPAGRRKPKSREERRLIASMVRANSVIHRAAGENPKYNGMGTTCVGAFFVEEGVMIAHVGDSRCYRLRGDELRQMTEDHSLANEYIRSKIFAPKICRVSPIKTSSREPSACKIPSKSRRISMNTPMAISICSVPMA